MGLSSWGRAFAWSLLALPAVVGIWGFTVDDALISARVAENLAQGAGYRFNTHGPVTDAVTPLGWAHFLSLAGGRGVWNTFEFARYSGALAWLVAVAVLGRLLGNRPPRAQLVAALSLATCLPLAAWATAGMETPFVTLLAVAALSRTRWGQLAAGIAGALRPELIPWAVTLSVLRCQRGQLPGARTAALSEQRQRLWALGLATVPAALVAGVRLVAFGTPVPLAALAKPSDFSHGLNYVAVGMLLSGPPWLLLGASVYSKLKGDERALLYAFVVHLTSLVLAGGDWMSFFRLLVPVLPSVIYLGACIAGHARLVATLARLFMALLSTGSLWWLKAEAARGVVASRLELIEAARAPLASAQVVAALDVGWVGAATPATIVDLAGVTDPAIASFAGGHTTKTVPSSLLVARQVDSLVLLLDDGASLSEPWYESRFYYGVDVRLARGLSDLPFEPVAKLPLQGSAKQYVIVQLEK